MRKHSRKSNFRDDSMLTLSVQKVLVPSPDTTIPPSTNLSRWRKIPTEVKTFSLSIESHITIRPQVELSRKRVSLLLEQEIVRVNSEGFNLLDYFAFEWMLNYLIGSNSVREVNGKQMSVVVYCCHLILLQYRENWSFLYKRTSLLSELSSLIGEIFGDISDRKYQGRNSVYQIDKFLLVKIENVNSISERSQNSVRYSSYCKGYGEGGRSVRRQSTRYSDELDRDDSIVEIPEEFFSFGKSIHYQEDLFFLEQLILEKKKR